MRSLTGRAAALLFGSGFCALVYQVGWLRDFRLIFGASTAASAAVIAIFIGGLGIGSLWLGPKADRHPRPLLFYAQLETIIAVSAAASPLLLMLVRQLYLASGGTMRLGLAVSTIERLILSALVLAVPTIAMGGTLPAAARAVTQAGDVRRHDVAVLYGVNTLGAVAGCVVATFWLLELLGTRQTMWLAAAINLLVAMVARQIERNWAGEAGGAGRAEGAGEAGRAGWEAGGVDRTGSEAGRAEQKGDATPPAPSTHPAPHPAPHPAHPAYPAPPAPPAYVLTASAIVGFAFFLMELVWYRLLAPLLGGSVFTFGLVLAIALVGIGVGGLLYTLTASDRPATLAGFATSCLLEALAVAGTFALGDRVAILALVLLPLRVSGFAATVGGWTIVASIVVLPPAIIAGYQFPMLIALLGRGRDRIGRQVGLTYAANTFGAITGSLAGGFGLLPWLSAPGIWRLVAIVLALLGVAGALLAARASAPAATAERDEQEQPRARGALRVLVPRLLAAVLVIALLAAPGPTAVWRHSGIGAGRVAPDVLNSPNRLKAWRQSSESRIVWEADGVESSVAFVTGPHGYAFLVNGKSDGSARADAGTQVMLGLLGALAHPAPERALVVGLGTGATSGWLAGVPSIQRVDTIELEPLVLEVARACAVTNFDAMRNAKHRVSIGDAREALLTSRDRYDVIASEPSNPFRAGIASLFTQEFYRAARDRLTSNGVFAQWVQGYEIDIPTMQTIYATMASVFPQVETWQTQSGDLVLLAFMQPHAYSTRALAARAAEEPFRTALHKAWRVFDVNGLLAHYAAGDKVARRAASEPAVDVNTDDRNIVEFGLARSVGGSGLVIINEIQRIARQLGASRPPISDGDGVSWTAVDTARVAINAGDRGLDLPAEGPPGEVARRRALVQYYGADDVASARTLLAQQSEPPGDVIQLAMAADIAAQHGAEAEAWPLIERLRAYQPAEADILLAMLRLAQGRATEATAALEAAFLRLRTDPWPALPLMQKAIGLVDPIVARDPAAAQRLFDALREPFSVRGIDSPRLVTAADLSRRLDFPGLCRVAIGPLEPYPPWSASMLEIRRDCYQATGDARLPLAVRDLSDYYAHEPMPLAREVRAR